jgi:DNA-binding response OmpR family regulator
MPNIKKILIVEDERPLAHALELKLEHEGFSVAVAVNGQEALDMLAKQTFDLVLLDLVMPEMDGFQVLEKLKDTPDKPIFFVLSNLSQHEDETRVRELGAQKFYIKSDTPLTTIVEDIKAL